MFKDREILEMLDLLDNKLTTIKKILENNILKQSIKNVKGGKKNGIQ